MARADGRGEHVHSELVSLPSDETAHRLLRIALSLPGHPDDPSQLRVGLPYRCLDETDRPAIGTKSKAPVEPPLGTARRPTRLQLEISLPERLQARRRDPAREPMQAAV